MNRTTGFNQNKELSPRVQTIHKNIKDNPDLFKKGAFAGANFSFIDLSDTDLSDGIFQKTRFRHATLVNSNFAHANLSYTVFEGANLEKANFEGAIIIGAHLGGANLVKSNFTGAIIKGINFRGAKYSDSTIFPEGFDPESHGMKKVEG